MTRERILTDDEALATELSSRDIRHLFDLAQRGSVRPNGDRFSKWMLGVMSLLVASGVGGAILVFGQVASLRAEVRGARTDIDRLYRLVEPRLRGAPENPDAEGAQ